MRSAPLGFALLVMILPISLALVTAPAEERDSEVGKVGPHALRASEVTRRLLALPTYQREALSQSTPNLARAFTDSVLVPELLLGLEAEARKLQLEPAAQDRVRAVLVQAVRDDLRREVLQVNPVSSLEVERYFEANAAEFQRPRALRLWRILVADEDTARKVLSEARGPHGVDRWSALSREWSQDHATRERRGDLGFVRADGSTDVPSLYVEPALFAAADRVRDGDLVPAPLRVGQSFAVIWRRGSLAPRAVPLSEASSRIRRLLENQRGSQALEKLLAELERAQLRHKDLSLLDQAPPPAP